MSKSNNSSQISFIVIFILILVLTKMIPPVVHWFQDHDAVFAAILSFLGLIGIMIFVFNWVRYYYLTNLAKTSRLMDASKRADELTGRTIGGGYQKATLNDDYFRLQDKAIKTHKSRYQLGYWILIVSGLALIIISMIFLIQYKKWMSLFLTVAAGIIMGTRMAKKAHNYIEEEIKNGMSSEKSFEASVKKSDDLLKSFSSEEISIILKYMKSLNENEKAALMKMISSSDTEQCKEIFRKILEK